MSALRVFPNRAALARAAARRVEGLLRARAARGRSATLVLSGGRTPLALYRSLNPLRAPWRRVHLLWGDERWVPRGHRDSNAGRTARRFLRTLGVPIDQVHFPPVGLARPADGARAYERTLRTLLRRARPDVVLLGLGTDGHTASLFPGGAALRERRRWVRAVLDAPKPPARRLTVTPPFLRRARHVLVLVTGSDKAPALRAARARGGVFDQWALRPGVLEWWVDRAAAP